MAALIAGRRTCISNRKPYNATSGLSEKSQTERSRTFLLGDWAHLGRQTESEPVPLALNIAVPTRSAADLISER
jgi:hypothetical protein